MYTITGFDEIYKKLSQLEPKLQKKLANKGMRKAMKVIQQEVKNNVPVLSGLTKKAVKVRAMKRSRKGYGIEVRIGEGDYKGETFYASFIEYGTKYIKPRGFMKSAFEQSGEKAKQIAIEEMGKLIMETAKE